MGTDMEVRDLSFCIRLENLSNALKALKQLVRDTAHLSFVDRNEVLKADNFGEAMSACNWNSTFAGDAGVTFLRFQGDRAGAEEALFTALAPFVENGSYIEFAYPGYDNIELYEFDDGELEIVHGKLEPVWERACSEEVVEEQESPKPALASDSMRCCKECLILKEGECLKHLVAIEDPSETVCNSWEPIDQPKVLKVVEISGVSLIPEKQSVSEHCKVIEVKRAPIECTTCWDCNLRVNGGFCAGMVGRGKVGESLKKTDKKDGRESWCPLPLTFVPGPPKDDTVLKDARRLASMLINDGDRQGASEDDILLKMSELLKDY